MRTLRGEHTRVDTTQLFASTHAVKGITGDALEIIAEFEPGDARAFGTKVHLTAYFASKRVCSVSMSNSTFPSASLITTVAT